MVKLDKGRVIFMNYEEMLEFVKKTLESTDKIKPNNPMHAFRNRYLHSYRVYMWARRIADDLECNREVLYTAAIFHDVGYSVEKNNHAMHSEMIFRRYAVAHNFDASFTDSVAGAIALHSHKELLNDPATPAELILLMEADLLDEEGALGIAWDLLARGAKGAKDYTESLEALKIHSGHILNQDYMVTKRAKMYWNHKKELVRSFINELVSDLFLEEENGI